MTQILPYQVYLASRPKDLSWTGPSLQSILSTPEGQKAFATHLSTEMSLENLYYYNVATDWTKNYEARSLIQRVDRADYIADTYLTPGAILELNISGTIRESLLHRISQRDLSQDMFDESAAAIFALMDSDSFHRFKRSNHFDAYMADLTFA